MNKLGSLLTLLVSAVMGLAIMGFVLTRPAAHWDVIAYVAAALKALGAEGMALHRATYEIIREAYDPATFAVLTSTPEAGGHGAYRNTIYSDPVALEQQLPFYRIRVAYIFMLNALAPVTGGLVGAAHLISATCAGLITCVTGWLLLRGPRGLPPAIVMLALPLIMAGAAVIEVGQLETPDALAALIALVAIALLHSNRRIALCLLVLLVLVRTDGVLLMALAVLLMWIEGDRRLVHYLLATLGLMLYAFINYYYGNYGHLVLFNFTLMNPAPDPYPATMALETDVLAYVKVYVFAILRFAPTLLLAAFVFLLAVADIRKDGRMVPLTAQVILALGFLVSHFALFPLGSERHYVFAVVFAGVYAVQTLLCWAADSGKAVSQPPCG